MYIRDQSTTPQDLISKPMWLFSCSPKTINSSHDRMVSKDKSNGSQLRLRRERRPIRVVFALEEAVCMNARAPLMMWVYGKLLTDRVINLWCDQQRTMVRKQWKLRVPSMNSSPMIPNDRRSFKPLNNQRAAVTSHRCQLQWYFHLIMMRCFTHAW